MKLRSIIVLICLLALALAAALWYVHGKRYEVVIKQQQIDEALQAKFRRYTRFSDSERPVATNVAVRAFPDCAEFPLPNPHLLQRSALAYDSRIGITT
jgi:hypothetical protein